MERPARMRGGPFADFRVLVGGVLVDDRMHDSAAWDPRLDGIEKAGELPMAMALRITADHRAVQDIQRGEERRRSVRLIQSWVIAPRRPFFSGSPGWVRSRA